jgi:hypothetical protein
MPEYNGAGGTEKFRGRENPGHGRAGRDAEKIVYKSNLLFVLYNSLLSCNLYSRANKGEKHYGYHHYPQRTNGCAGGHQATVRYSA